MPQFVFMLGVGRNGSYFLRSLLDWHPQALVLPISLKFHELWKLYDWGRISDPDELARRLLDESKVSVFRHRIHRHALTGHERDYSAVSWPVFEQELHAYLRAHGTASRTAFLAVFHAYAKAIGKDLEQVAVAVAEAVYVGDISAVLADFPDARFVHLVRDHRANVSSLKSYFQSQYGCLVVPGTDFANASMVMRILKDSIGDVMRMMHRESRARGGERYRIVRFEDLKLAPEATMRGLARWLGIGWDDSLLRPTLAGAPYAGDSGFGSQPVLGFDPAPIDRWRLVLRPHEVRMIEFLFAESMIAAGYKPEHGQSRRERWLGALSCLLPWQGELFYTGFRWNADKVSRLKRLLRPFWYLRLTVPMYVWTRLLLLRSYVRGDFKLV